jgi:hypothetical protein
MSTNRKKKASDKVELKSDDKDPKPFTALAVSNAQPLLQVVTSSTLNPADAESATGQPPTGTSTDSNQPPSVMPGGNGEDNDTQVHHQHVGGAYCPLSARERVSKGDADINY